MKEKLNFKMVWVPLLLTLILAVCAIAKDKDSAGVLVLQGEVMDSQCAYNVHSTSHSHESMTEKGVFGRDARSCTLHCAKEMAGVFVLIVKKEVYRLEDQGQAEQFAGRKVKVSGTLDTKTHTLHVLTMVDDQ
ncbi:MAG TPA: hypothetical protein VI685_26660 [Candidatus Angelobacter sp.]